MQPDRTRPRAGALFAINMLVGTAGGGTYTFDEIAAGLTQAGFERVRLFRRARGWTRWWRPSRSAPVRNVAAIGPRAPPAAR